MQEQQIDWCALPSDIAEGFREFHAENPHVYDALVSMARDLVARGYRRVGMAMLFEILRWDHMMKTDCSEPFKLNNNYKAYYARLIEAREPDLVDVFTKRQSASDTEVAA